MLRTISTKTSLTRHDEQPGKKKSRRTARVEKAAKVAPRPVDKLRPVVRCPTIKYNRRVRAGRGFSLQELKAAGISRKLAPTIGIAVDPRRQNLSQESIDANVARLKEFSDRLILFPRRNGKTKKGDASAADVKAAKEGKVLKKTSDAFPISNAIKITEAKISEVPATENAYRTLRDERADARLVGIRAKRAKAKADAAEAAKK